MSAPGRRRLAAATRLQLSLFTITTPRLPGPEEGIRERLRAPPPFWSSCCSSGMRPVTAFETTPLLGIYEEIPPLPDQSGTTVRD